MSERLRRADPEAPGIRGQRRGRGFRYLDAEGKAVTDADVLARIDELVIPPAWRKVWICADRRGHIQAIGVDDAGRRQYLYHPQWRVHRDRQKFDEMLSFAEALPGMRRRLSRLLNGDGLSHDRVLACAIGLLDRAELGGVASDVRVCGQGQPAVRGLDVIGRGRKCKVHNDMPPVHVYSVTRKY